MGKKRTPTGEAQAMLKDLISKFEQAAGRSEFVIAVFCDIREFAAFSKGREAPDIASLIKRFYANLLRDYFTEAVFAKPAGDGVLLIFSYSEKTLTSVAENVISNCLKVVKDFPTMFDGDPMINFEVPQKVGFGIARGTAFCLYAGKHIVDYSGQVLNLSSRLNSLAKPQGIIIDGAFQINLLKKELKEQFTEDAGVYIRGIFERKPTKIFYTTDVCTDEFIHHPIAEKNWQKIEKKFTSQELKKFTFIYYQIVLPEDTEYPNDILVKASWIDKKTPGYTSSRFLNEKAYKSDANGPRVVVLVSEIRDSIASAKLKASDNITLEAHYIPKATPTQKSARPNTTATPSPQQKTDIMDLEI